MTESQVANAKGLKFLVARDEKTGKFEKVASGGTEIWDKDPSTQAYQTLMAYYIDLPGKPPEDVNLRVTGDITSALNASKEAARKRKAGK